VRDTLVIGQETTPQVLIRVGLAPTAELPPATPRRPLDEVLIVCR
jgi:hypothetical protein